MNPDDRKLNVDITFDSKFKNRQAVKEYLCLTPAAGAGIYPIGAVALSVTVTPFDMKLYRMLQYT